MFVKGTLYSKFSQSFPSSKDSTNPLATPSVYSTYCSFHAVYNGERGRSVKPHLDENERYLESDHLPNSWLHNIMKKRSNLNPGKSFASDLVHKMSFRDLSISPEEVSLNCWWNVYLYLLLRIFWLWRGLIPEIVFPLLALALKVFVLIKWRTSAYSEPTMENGNLQHKCFTQLFVYGCNILRIILQKSTNFLI